MKRIKLIGLIVFTALCISCENENDFEVQDRNANLIESENELGAKGVDLSIYNGSHGVTSCESSENPKEEISFFITLGESGDLRLFELNGERVFKIFEVGSDNEISVATDEYTIAGKLVNGQPVFDLFYNEQNYCSNPPDIDTIFAYKGLHTVFPCSGVEDTDGITFRLGVGEIGLVDISEFNRKFAFAYFTTKEGGIITLEAKEYSITGTLVDGKPVFEVNYNNTDYCSASVDLDVLSKFKGDYELASCDGSSDNTVSFGTLLIEPGTLVLESFNGATAFKFFTYKNGVVTIEFESVLIEGKLVNGQPVFTASTGDVNFCEKEEEITDSTIMASNGNYVNIVEGSNFLVANSKDQALAKQFEIVKLANGKVAFKTNNGKYLSSENGAKPMTANRTAIGSWEQFIIEELSEGKVAIKANNGKYVSSENGVKPMNSNRNAIGRWEIFLIK